MKKRFYGSRYVQNDPKVRFDAKYQVNNDNGCWEWTACLNEWGYGQFKYEGKMMLAHRVAFILYRGENPDKLLVCHTCDNPKCVNPDHLFLGTNKDNCDDKISKNRQPKRQHPGITAYLKGCKCVECKAYYAAYQRKRKLDKIAAAMET